MPDAAEVGFELRPLVGRHRRRALELGELQHHVPLAAALVDAAQLAQGGAVGAVETREDPVGLAGGVEIEDPVFEDLAETEEERALLGGVVRDRRRVQAIAIDTDEGRPVAFEEEMFLERLEGAAIVGIACEDLLLRVETLGQGILAVRADGVRAFSGRRIDRDRGPLDRRFRVAFRGDRDRRRGWENSGGRPDPAGG
ncbi:MAG: hypothetical protein IPK00_04255 [Deltaproteobacteria bacterium]|nr:hypothetical protein [Deltaproteobacteria bacterium]